MGKILKYAFLRSVPVMLGYVFIGIAFGILLQQAGFSAIWAFFISLVVFAGSMQFVLISFLSAGSPLSLVAVMTLLINSRHMFYGLSFIERFQQMGKRYLYMVFSLTDETYSVLCSMKEDEHSKEEQDQGMFWVALMDQCYWIFGSVFGSVLGQTLPVDFTGIDFAMTALFAVIFTDQWRSFPSRLPAVVGLISSAAFLALLGPDRFILPSLAATVLVLLVCRTPVERKMEKRREEANHAH